MEGTYGQELKGAAELVKGGAGEWNKNFPKPTICLGQVEENIVEVNCKANNWGHPKRSMFNPHWTDEVEAEYVYMCKYEYSMLDQLIQGENTVQINPML